MKQLKQYQDVAVYQLLRLSDMYLKIPGVETLVLQSPTGSGKTFMITNYLYEMSKKEDYDLCFLWVSIGKGELQVQSYKNVKRELDEALKCSLLEEEFFGSRTEIDKNEVVFVNWEKIRNKDKTTGDFKNIIMKDKETINFPEVLENTRSIGRKIILIIDESHVASTTNRATEIRDTIIKPELTIEMSATPVLMNGAHPVKIQPNDVIKEGMIKKEIIINKGIDEVIKIDDELNSEMLILESAYLKQEELKKKYAKAFETEETAVKITPLVLVQLPNSVLGEEKKENVLKFLESKGATINNGKVAVWLSDETINKDSETLLPLDSKVEYLLFKMAIDTGWDCPRAQILVKFRETNSITFEIQTVGRILRMPETKHYQDEDLNRSYVYTNVQAITIKPEVYNPNIIKSLTAKRTDKYTTIYLKSYYHNRVDYGDITSSFYKVFEHEFCKYFDITQITEDNYIPTQTFFYDNSEKLKEKGITTDYGKNDSILNDVHIDSTKVDSRIKLEDSNLFGVYASPSDLQSKFEKIINTNLNGFAPKRSISKVKKAIFITFKKYLGLKTAKGGIMYIQNLVCSNYDIFSQIINISTDKYKPIHEVEVSAKSDERFNDHWEIAPEKNYNPETTQSFESKLSLYQPLFIEKVGGKVNELEMNFIKYLDNHEDKIEWFWKNGSEHMEDNFGIQKADKSTFQPDFIIKFKDGSIGIFDTKGGQFTSDDAVKSAALYKYIYDERNNGHNLFGGLVILDGNIFKYFESIPYVPYNQDPTQWKPFDELLK